MKYGKKHIRISACNRALLLTLAFCADRICFHRLIDEIHTVCSGGTITRFTIVSKLHSEHDIVHIHTQLRSHCVDFQHKVSGIG
jgi:hypothetical protein